MPQRHRGIGDLGGEAHERDGAEAVGAEDGGHQVLPVDVRPEPYLSPELEEEPAGRAALPERPKHRPEPPEVGGGDGAGEAGVVEATG